MPVFSPQRLQAIGVRLFDALGSPHAESEWVVETLVRANLMGHDSHGVVRIRQYADSIRAGQIKPGTTPKVTRERPTTAVVDAGLGWGQVAVREAMQLAIRKARQYAVGMVVVQNLPHSGRMGEWASMAAAQNMLGYVVANSHGGRPSVVPWGGIDGRFTPNPLAFAAPCGEEWPVLIDITTSTLPEGKVRVARHRGVQLPPDCIIDADGNPTTDPNRYYGPPPGALLPLGGAVGHKGYGLAVMTELLAGILSAAGYSGEALAVPVPGNGLFLQVIDINAFTDLATFIQRTQDLIAYVKSSRLRPGVSEILFPGEPEYRTSLQRSRDGIQIEDSILDEMQAVAQQAGLAALE